MAAVLADGPGARCARTGAPTRAAWSRGAASPTRTGWPSGSRRRPGRWAELNSPARLPLVYRDLRRAARRGDGDAVRRLPARADGEERLVGQITLGNIVRRAFCSAYAGYWVDSRVAGRGVIPTALALAVDHAFGAGGLHRIEVNIRPENGPAGAWWRSWASARRRTTRATCTSTAPGATTSGTRMTTEDVAAEGGLLARWHRLRAQPDRLGIIRDA